MAWFKKPINIGITVGAVILAVVAAALLFWGVTHHTEGGILKVCWSEEGVATYHTTGEGGDGLGDGTCERPEELHWSREQIPLTLAALSSEREPLGEDSFQVRALLHAVTDLNQEVGFELFRVGGRLDASDADVRFGGPLEGGGDSPPPGHVLHVRTGNGDRLRGHCWVRSDVESDVRLLHLVLKHELLHLPGLEHDDFTLSIMYPITGEDWDRYRMSTAHVTDYDISNLQRLYKPPVSDLD